MRSKLIERDKARAKALEEMHFFDGGENYTVFNAGWDAALAAYDTDDRIKELREALEKCRDKFLDYHWQHFNKAHADEIEPAERKSRMQKSDANLKMADMCDTALKKDA